MASCRSLQIPPSHSSDAEIFLEEVTSQFLTCRLCKNPYKRPPKSLHCLHAFCGPCLERFQDSNSSPVSTTWTSKSRYVQPYRSHSSRTIICPVCSRTTELPPGGVCRLPDNLLLEQLGQVVQRLRESSRTESSDDRDVPTVAPLCDVCRSSRGRTSVIMSCLQENKNKITGAKQIGSGRKSSKRSNSTRKVEQDDSDSNSSSPNERRRRFNDPVSESSCSLSFRNSWAILSKKQKHGQDSIDFDDDSRGSSQSVEEGKAEGFSYDHSRCSSSSGVSEISDDISPSSTEAPAAVAKCIDCNKLLCEGCKQHHRQLSVTSSHSLVDIDCCNDVECKTHHGEPLRYYCQACRLCICLLCTLNEHNAHDVISLQDGVSIHRLSLVELAERCRDRRDYLRHYLEQIEGAEIERDECMAAVHRSANMAVSALREKEEAMIGEIENVYGPDLQSVIGERSALLDDLKTLENICRLADMILDNNSVELLLMKDEMDSKCRSLLEKQLRELPGSLKNPNRNSFKFINDDGLVMFSDVFTSEVTTLDASTETDVKLECKEETALERNIGTSSTQTKFWLKQEPYEISDVIMDTDFMIEVLEGDVTDSLSSFQINNSSNITSENLTTDRLTLTANHYIVDEPGLIVIVADVDVDIPLETFYLVTDMDLGSNCNTEQHSNICAKCFEDLEKSLNSNDSIVEKFSKHCNPSNKSESKSVISEEVKSEQDKERKTLTNVIICIQDDKTPIQCYDIHSAEIPTTFYFPATHKDINSGVTQDSSTQTIDSKSTQKCNNKNVVSGEDLMKKLDNEIELNCSRKVIQNILLKGQHSDTERCSSLPSELNIVSLMSHRETFLKTCKEILEQSESSLKNTYSKSTCNKSKATELSALQLDCNRTDMEKSEIHRPTSSNGATDQSTDKVEIERQSETEVSSKILSEKTISNTNSPVTYCDVTTSTDISTKDAATFTFISISNVETATEIETCNKDTSTDFKTSDAAVSTDFNTVDASSSTDVTNSDATTLTDVITTSHTGCGDGNISCKSAGICTDAIETKSVGIGERNVVYTDTCTGADKIEMVDSGCGETCVVLVCKDIATETVLESIEASCKINEQADSDRNIDFQKENTDINKICDNLDDNLAQRKINFNKACGNLDDNLVQRIQYVAENNDSLEDQTDTSILFIPEISVITPETASENCRVKLKENAVKETSIENKIHPLNLSSLKETLQEALQENVNHKTNRIETNICSTFETGKSSSMERSLAESDHVLTNCQSAENSLDGGEETANRYQTDREDEDTNSESEEFTSCLALNVNVEEKSRGPSENICSKSRNQISDQINSKTEENNSVHLSTSDNGNSKTEVSEKLQIKNAKTELDSNNVRQETSTDTFSANGMSGSYSDLGSILLTSLPSFLALADRTFSASTSDIPSEKNGKHCYLLTGLRPIKSDECLNVEFRRRRGILLSEKSLSRTTVSGKSSRERESSSREYLSPSLELASIKDCDRNSLPIVFLSDESVNGLEDLPVLEIDETFHSVLSLNGNDENNCNDNSIAKNLEELTNGNKSELNKTDVTIRKCLQKPKLFIGALFELLSGAPNRDPRDFNNIEENQKIESSDQKSDDSLRNFHVPCENTESTKHNSTAERDIVKGVCQDDYNLDHSNESNINLLEKYSKISHTLNLPNSPMVPQKKRESKENYSDDYQFDNRGNKSTDTSKSLLSTFTAPKFSVQVHKLSILKRLDSFEHKQ